jgi:hypothetical protein
VGPHVGPLTCSGGKGFYLFLLARVRIQVADITSALHKHAPRCTHSTAALGDSATARLSATCRAMQDQAEHDLLQCESCALLHRWGTSMSTHARTGHKPSSCIPEVLTPLSETHPTRASLVGLATD